MERDLQDVIVSQQKMLKRLGKGKGNEKNYPVGLEMAYRKNLEQVKEWTNKEPNVEVLFVEYEQVIKSPRKEAVRINEFLDDQLNIRKMVEAVDDKLNHARVKTTS